MSARTSSSHVLIRLLIVGALLLAGTVFLLSNTATGAGAAATATAAKGVPDEVFCPPDASKTGWENKVPKGKDQSKNASCDDCRPIPAYVKCKLWWGGQSAGGGQSVDHSGWPGITGIRWEIVGENQKKTKRTGTVFNDEFLGRHHNDTFSGGDGDDVIWGDANNFAGQKPYPHQTDKLTGGNGDDWIYASKGKNTISAGAGDDIVVAYNGRGKINCGSGKDKVVLLKKTPYKVKNCEKVTHPASK
jgi:hypothetical protein